MLLDEVLPLSCPWCSWPGLPPELLVLRLVEMLRLGSELLMPEIETLLVLLKLPLVLLPLLRLLLVAFID